MFKAAIKGVGHYVPARVVTNAELTTYMDTSHEWIVERTGIHERHFFEEGTDTVSNMGVKAAKMALERAKIDVSDIDLIIFATLSPDYFFPGPGVLVQRELGLKNIPALDIRQQCAGFIYGLSIADQYIKTGLYKTVLLIGSEIQSSMMEMSNRGRNTAVIFGDGAGAVIIQRSDDASEILSTHTYADGSQAEELYMANPGSIKKERLNPEMLTDGSMLPVMNGTAVFKEAVTKMPAAVKEALETNNYTTEDLTLLIPHQANLRIAQMVQKQLGLRDDQVFNNIQKYGNTTAASIPLALSEAWEQGLVKKGDLVCFTAFGSGFVWGSALVRF